MIANMLAMTAMTIVL